MTAKAKDWRDNGRSIRDEMIASYEKVGEELKKTFAPSLQARLDAPPSDETIL